jgi:hypothetical protein
MELSHIRMFIKANYMSCGIYCSVGVRNEHEAFVSVVMVTDMSASPGPTEVTARC